VTMPRGVFRSTGLLTRKRKRSAFCGCAAMVTRKQASIVAGIWRRRWCWLAFRYRLPRCSTPIDSTSWVFGELVVSTSVRACLHGSIIGHAPKQTQLAFSKPEPDVSIASGDIEDYADRDPGPADLAMVVEIAASSVSEDRQMAKVYGPAGIPVYWIVNLKARQVEVYSLLKRRGTSLATAGLGSSGCGNQCPSRSRAWRWGD
jgi:Putative restriction endonuclease